MGDSRHPNFVLIAANPRAGSQSRDRHLRELAEWLRERGRTVEILSDLPRVEQLATRLFEQGELGALVGAGGDGTLAELMNRTPPGTPLAVYPAGTANLVARHVGAIRRVPLFGQMLLDRLIVRLDAGRANGRLFMAICSCGFDADVVARLHAARTGHITPWAYFRPILTAIRGYTFPELQVSSAEGSMQTAHWAFISNLPCYAGGLKPGAGACGTDGLLDVCTFDRGGLLSALRYLPYLFLGAQGRLADCQSFRSGSVRIESAAPGVHYELDGDPGGTLPVEIDILPGRLTLIVPRSYAEAASQAGIGH